ncbi:MAG TPA: hypothetical protein VLH09_06330, partial [Bryobacteraceae bacterium]|nr:hypothetical protein [Bryobacteraceae bacterium]
MKRWLVFACLLSAAPAPAQRDFLTAAEIDQLREIQDPDARLQLYAGFAAQRMAQLQQLVAKEKTGRSRMIHEVLGEYTSIVEAIDAVSDDALRRSAPLDAGIKAVVDGHKRMLGSLEKIAESRPKDLEAYKFALEQAILATRDSLELAEQDLKTRSSDVQAREAKERKEREALMRPEELQVKRDNEQKE